ncbi:hypothetical protein [Brevibacillus laterosporus]|uniref:hypothetical protein n=1 Tax=Brevibacillus laterosporus TaxID=1465 RepID=UPI000839D11F|nr:hypothetical protein [Brevibacillus laterosporus]
MMTREEIEAIRKRAEDATVGSWRFCGDKFGDLIVYSPEIRGFRNNGGEIAVLTYGSDEDAEFIAHAREDIPKLLAEIERLQTNWQRLEGYADDWRDKAVEDHDVSESNGAQYFFAGRLSAFNNVREMIQALEREGAEC